MNNKISKRNLHKNALSKIPIFPNRFVIAFGWLKIIYLPNE